jgi:hypothetical protein
MHVGDRVRLLHSKEEGIIKRALKDNVFEIEIEDGFLIPVTRRELVLVAKEEDKYFMVRSEESAPYNRNPVSAPKNTVLSGRGIYLGFDQKNEREVELEFINNTDYRILLAIFEVRGEDESCVFNGAVDARSKVSGSSYFLDHFDNWPSFLCQAIFVQNKGDKRPELLNKLVKLKASNFFKSKSKAPVINKEIYLFQLDAEQTNLKPDELRERLMGDRPLPEPATMSSPTIRPASEVDLHAEALGLENQKQNTGEILKLQIEAFEKVLDAAMLSGMDNITFIHGVGNGVLRNEIHKRLSKLYPKVGFRDGKREKFGYGATIVEIK